MIKNYKLFDFILLFISAITIIYFLLLICNSVFIITYLAYPIISIIFTFYAYYELKHNISLLSKLPIKLNYFIKSIAIIGILLFIIIEGLIIHESNNQHLNNSDYIIVLGAKLNGHTPSKSLQYRLDATYKYHQLYPKIPIIVSGGQGNGEQISEAKAMKNYLIEKGVDEKLILEENKSTNTNENIIFSKKIIDSLNKNNPQVTIITNGFHCYRSKLLANKHNLNAQTYSAKENLYTTPHYYIREFFGCIKDILIS